jgi:Protein of unknown function (DUF2950)
MRSLKGGTRMFNMILSTNRYLLWRTVLGMGIATIMMVCITYMHANATDIKQKSYASPEEAVKALVDAVKANNNDELLAIFGPGSEDIISSGDEVDDKTHRERFLSAYSEMNTLEKETPDKTVLHVGSRDWTLPIPIVKRGERWVFDTNAGRVEILNRRIGRNELSTIEVLHAYVDAQHEYASKDRNGDGSLEFAQKLVSTNGKHDGLYWEAKEGKEMSPFGPLAAKAAREGYTVKEGDGSSPYHGYFYRILKGQGKNAPGGQYDYVVNGKMVLGFALVAYPAKYGSSGIMTFIVNQQGMVYEKDLGKNTAKIVESIKRYDPDSTWKKVKEATKS